MSDTISPQDLKELLSNPALKLLDVRRKDFFKEDPTVIPGASWKDPVDISIWSQDLTPQDEVVIYCARGGSISKSVLGDLRAKSLKVRYVEGGFEGWKEAGFGTETP